MSSLITRGLAGTEDDRALFLERAPWGEAEITFWDATASSKVDIYTLAVLAMLSVWQPACQDVETFRTIEKEVRERENVSEREAVQLSFG